MTLAADITPIPLSLIDTDLDAAAAGFGDAFARTGFAVVSDHGIDQGLIDAAMAATKAFLRCRRPSSSLMSCPVAAASAG